MNTETVNKSFECAGSAYLSLSNVRGKVDIHAGDDNLISIQAVKFLDSGDAENTVIETSQDDDGKVHVKTSFNRDGFPLLGNRVPCKVNYEVSVPKDCDVKLRGVSNTAKIVGIAGQLDISTVSGDLELLSLAGELKIKTVSGDVQGENIRGQVRLEAVSGDVFLQKSELAALRGKTVSGDLSFETPLASGPYELSAVSGDISMVIKQLTGVSVSSSSLSGDIRTDLPISQENHSRNRHSIQVMDGSAQIHHSSVSGDILLSSADVSGAAEEVHPLEASQLGVKSNTEILKSLERGEISVEAAVSMIEQGKIS